MWGANIRCLRDLYFLLTSLGSAFMLEEKVPPWQDVIFNAPDASVSCLKAGSGAQQGTFYVVRTPPFQLS